MRIDPATAREESVVFAHPDFDVFTLEGSRERKVLLYAEFTTWKRERKCFDPFASDPRDLESQLPGYEINRAVPRQGRGMFIVATWSDRTQGARYLYDAATRQLMKLAEITP